MDLFGHFMEYSFAAALVGKINKTVVSNGKD